MPNPTTQEVTVNAVVKALHGEFAHNQQARKPHFLKTAQGWVTLIFAVGGVGSASVAAITHTGRVYDHMNAHMHDGAEVLISAMEVQLRNHEHRLNNTEAATLLNTAHSAKEEIHMDKAQKQVLAFEVMSPMHVKMNDMDQKINTLAIQQQALIDSVKDLSEDIKENTNNH